MAPPVLSTPAEYAALVDSTDTFLLDCDGVLYHGPAVVPGVIETLRFLRAKGKKIVFVTNNATKSRRVLQGVLNKIGIEASASECFGSAYASAVYISKVLKLPKDKRVYIVGENGIEEELDAVGVSYCGGTDPEERVFLPTMDFSTFVPDPTVGAVLCGFDMYINYKKIGKAYTYLRDDPSVHFLLTNTDSTFPTHGTTYPGSGALSSPIVYALKGKREPTVIGKPSTTMMDAVIAEHEFDPKRALMVGDNLSTDILFGNNSGVRTLLVMGGVTKREQVFGESPSDIVPDMVMESFGDFAVLAADKA